MPRTSSTESVQLALLEAYEEVTNRVLEGETVDADLLRREYPEYAERLVTMLPALHALAFSAGQDDPGAGGATPGVLGDYRILREVGRGGMGIVYEAEQISLARRVALKILPFAAVLDPRQLQRFKNEAMAAAHLDHPNIVEVYGIGCERSIHFYAMRFVEGVTLAQVVEARRRSEAGSAEHGVRSTEGAAGAGSQEPGVGEARADADGSTSPHSSLITPHSSLPHDTSPVLQAALSTINIASPKERFRRIAELGVQAAEALEHAHQFGVVHRDIKPSNLLLDEHGKLWITDFGLAQVDSHATLTLPGDVLGTLRYMSPEQAAGRPTMVDHRTDIYSLGATLYELATDRPVVRGQDRAEILRKISEEDPAPPRKLVPSMPADLDTILLKCLNKEPSARYDSAMALAEDLRRFLDEKPVVARRQGALDRVSKWGRRHRGISTIGIAALMVITVIATSSVYLVFQAYQSENRQRRIAEANLLVASDSIDRLLSRNADREYADGELAAAEQLAADAMEFYERLLQSSDDPTIRHRAANAMGWASRMYLMNNRVAESEEADRRAIDILEPLVEQHPTIREYRWSLANSYAGVGEAAWALGSPLQAEEPFRRAFSLYQQLAEQSPDWEYQALLADAHHKMGVFRVFVEQIDAAELHYIESSRIYEQLPATAHADPHIVSAKGALASDRGQLEATRGNHAKALEWFSDSLAKQAIALSQNPTDPIATRYQSETYCRMVDSYVHAGRYEDAAAAVERMLISCKGRLEVYNKAIDVLLTCSARSQAIQSEGETAIGFRRRALEIAQQSVHATEPSAPALEAMASFLLFCDDANFRDPMRAKTIAEECLKSEPDRSGAWFALALAHYRLEEWDASERAIRHLSHLARSEHVHYAPLLSAMLNWSRGSHEQASRDFALARPDAETRSATDPRLKVLLDEAERLIRVQDTDAPPVSSIN